MAAHPQVVSAHILADKLYCTAPSYFDQEGPVLLCADKGTHESALLHTRFLPADAKRLLPRYFAALKETRIEPLLLAWLELPQGQRNALDAELHEIHSRALKKAGARFGMRRSGSCGRCRSRTRNWWRNWSIGP